MVTTVLCCVLSDPWGCRCASKHRRQLILVQAFLTVAALACVLTAALAGNSLHAHAVTSLPWVLWYVDDDAIYEYDVGSVNASHAPTFAARESSVVQEYMDADATNISGKYSLGFRHACLDRDGRGTGDRADDNGCFTHDVMEDTFYAFNDNHHSFHAAHTLRLLKTLLEASSGRKVIIPELQGPEPLFVTHAYRARDGTNFACSPSTTSATAGVSWSWPATIANCTQVYSKERHSFEAGFQGHHLYLYVRRSVTVPVNVTVPLEWYTIRGELLYAENSTLLTTCIPNQPEAYGCESVDVLLGAFRKQFDDCDVRQDLCNDYWRHPQAREPVAIPPTHPQPTHPSLGGPQVLPSAADGAEVHKRHLGLRRGLRDPPRDGLLRRGASGLLAGAAGGRVQTRHREDRSRQEGSAGLVDGGASDLGGGHHDSLRPRVQRRSSGDVYRAPCGGGAEKRNLLAPSPRCCRRTGAASFQPRSALASTSSSPASSSTSLASLSS